MLDVYLEAFAEPVGHIEGDTSDLRFRYSDSYLAMPRALPLSLMLPLTGAVYEPGTTRAFFAHLLPEGGPLRELARRHDIDENDLAGLLASAGAECAGAVSIMPKGAPPPKRPGVFPEDYHLLSVDELDADLRDLEAGRLVGDRRLQDISLAGVQAKIALFVAADGRPYAPIPAAPTTHILKVASPEMDYGTENEFFCMQLARKLELDVADVTFQRAPRSHLRVTRYDRIVDGERIYRIHQEDFAQALGLYPLSRKYSHHGGATAEDLFAVTDRLARPAIARRELLRAIVFAFLTGNSDAHAKNFAIVHGTDGARLAPFYDLTCVRLYPQYRQGFALSVGGAQDFAEVDPGAWTRFAKRAGFNPRYVITELKRLATAVLPAARDLEATLGVAGAPSKIISVIGEQIELVNRAFAMSIPADVPPFVARAPGWGTPS